MKKLSDRTMSTIIVIGLIVIAAIVQLGSCYYMGHTSRQKMEALTKADNDLSASLTSLPESNNYSHILKNQFGVFQEIKTYYTDLGVTYFQNYYAFTICRILFVTLSAIAGFLVGTKGYIHSSPPEKSFFLITILIASFYYFLPNTLQNKENLDFNLQKVKLFEGSQVKILKLVHGTPQATKDSLQHVIAAGFQDISANLDLSTVGIDEKDLGGNPIEKLKLNSTGNKGKKP